jgi:hypothetical protein
MAEAERERDAAVEETLFLTGGGTSALLGLGANKGGVAVPSVVFAFGFVTDLAFCLTGALVVFGLDGCTQV